MDHEEWKEFDRKQRQMIDGSGCERVSSAAKESAGSARPAANTDDDPPVSISACLELDKEQGERAGPECRQATGGAPTGDENAGMGGTHALPRGAHRSVQRKLTESRVQDGFVASSHAGSAGKR